MLPWAVALFTLALPYVPGLNTLLGFTPLSRPLILTLLGITLVYIQLNEGAKRIFYQRITQ